MGAEAQASNGNVRRGGSEAGREPTLCVLGLSGVLISNVCATHGAETITVECSEGGIDTVIGASGGAGAGKGIVDPGPRWLAASGA